MTKQTLDIGTNANDGTGDTLRSGGEKINDNFNELYSTLGGNSIATNGINAAYATHEMNGNGTVNDSDTLILFNSTGTIAATLSDGTSTGEYKIFLNINSGVATVTPTSFGNGTNFALSQYGSTQAVWAGSKWYLIGHKDSADTDVVIT
jgi:hypothetical protein